MRNNVVAIDMGSVNTNIYKLGEGIVLMEPSVIARSSSQKGKVYAVGKEAKKLIGKTASSSAVVFPIVEGQIADEKLASQMMEVFLNKITLRKFGLRPQVVLSVPCGIEADEIRQYEEVLKGAGVYNVSFVESPILTALGLQLPISDSSPYFIVDLGGGTTNIAAVSLGGVIAGISVNMGGKNIDAMIIKHLEECFDLKIGLLTAENAKIEIGTLVEGDLVRMNVSGRDAYTGKPRTISISSDDLRIPIKAFFDKIFEITEMLMAKLPAEVSAEVRKTGIYFAGGTSQIPGLEYYAKEILSIRATCYENPENATVVGGGIVAGDTELLKKVRINNR